MSDSDDHHTDNSDQEHQEQRHKGRDPGWRVKTLDEILEEKKRRKEREDKEKRSSLEDGELRAESKSAEPMNQGSEDERSDDALDIKPPQLARKKDKDSRSHRKEDRRKDKHKDRDEHERRRKHKRRSDHDDRVIREKDRSKDRRSDERDRRERERLVMEQARRREESRRERERLERIERERQRDREKRAERDRERIRREEVRRRPHDERRIRGDKRDRLIREEKPYRNRSQERHGEHEERKSARNTPIKHSDERHESKREEIDEADILEVNASGNEAISSANESSGAESEVEEPVSASESDVEEIEVSAEEESSAEESESNEEESGSASDSESESEEESSSNSSSSSGSESESEKEDKDQDANKDGPSVIQSKFDDPSSPSDTADDISEISNGEYLPESPQLSPVELKQVLPPYMPAISGCRSVEEFQCLNRIEEGTYGVVYRAKDKKTDEIVALKRLKMEKEKEGFPITSLREVNTLLKSQHPNIVTVREIVVGSNMDKIYIVMDYVEHDLKSLMETMKQPFTLGEVKCLLRQLLRAVRHLHDNWILHRDLKTSNLLLSHKGVLKVGDFGLAREYGSPLKQYTPIVVTLWYRAPELLLGAKEYSCPIDLWSVGCIFAEMLTMKALFPGRSEIDQLNRIFKELGTPSEKIWPGYSELPAVKKVTFADYPYNNLRNRFGAYLTDIGFELMNKFLTYNPTRRITADTALEHEYFKESPLPINESDFPTWPAKSEQPRNTKRETSPKAPEGGMNFNKLGEDDADIDKGFRLTLASQGSSAKGTGFNLKF
ncbi:cyclin-dependent kinase 11B-like [Glandiceps talaboti]